MTYEYVGKVVKLLKKKKIEKIIFHLLMCLPLIIFGGLFLVQIIRNWNGVNDITLLTLQNILGEVVSLFSPASEGAILTLGGAFGYFFSILGITETATLPYALAMAQIIYMIVIELIWLIYDVVIFIPRACRSLVERGM